MNWADLRFDWTQLRGFLVTAEEGSLSAAARALGLTQPTLGRQVSALEQRLGVALFERAGRGLVLTPSGQTLLPHARAMGEAAARISLAAAGQSQSIEGKLRITASDVYSAYLLPPVLTRLRDAAPRLEIEVVASNDLRDIPRREADIAIRHIRPEEPDLIARKLRDSTAHFYAAQSYIERHGRPETKDDLRRHEIISYGDTDALIAHLETLALRLSPDQVRLGSENGMVAWEMARQGLGLIIIADEVAAFAPEMQRLLSDSFEVQFPLWLTTHRELHGSARIRLVYDMLAEALAHPPRTIA